MAEKQIVIYPVAPHTNHGNTVAAWTLCGLVTIGFIIGAIGFDIASHLMLYVGIAIILVGLVAGLVLKKGGHGQGGAKTLARAKH